MGAVILLLSSYRLPLLFETAILWCAGVCLDLFRHQGIAHDGDQVHHPRCFYLGARAQPYVKVGYDCE